MTRPTRNRLLVALFWVGCLLLGHVLPGPLRLPFVVAVLGLCAVSYWVSRQFFTGRRHFKKKRWGDAMESFQTFERDMESSSLKRRLSWLAAGIYTRDPVAIARNNVGAVHLENLHLELAEAAFRSALELDRDYAVPHLNLALIAAHRKDAPSMEAALNEAQRLGLTDAKAHARVRATLAGRA